MHHNRTPAQRAAEGIATVKKNMMFLIQYFFQAPLDFEILLPLGYPIIFLHYFLLEYIIKVLFLLCQQGVLRRVNSLVI